MTKIERRTQIFATNLILDSEVEIKGKDEFGDVIVFHPRRQMDITMGEKEMHELVMELAEGRLNEDSIDMIMWNGHVIPEVFDGFIEFNKMN